MIDLIQEVKIQEIDFHLSYNKIKSKFNYDKTQENLIMRFKKYVPHYVPYECVRGT